MLVIVKRKLIIDLIHSSISIFHDSSVISGSHITFLDKVKLFLWTINMVQFILCHWIFSMCFNISVKHFDLHWLFWALLPTLTWIWVVILSVSVFCRMRRTVTERVSVSLFLSHQTKNINIVQWDSDDVMNCDLLHCLLSLLLCSLSAPPTGRYATLHLNDQ